MTFDIADGRPFPAREEMPEVFEDLKLLPIPLDGNLNNPSSPIPEDSAAPINDQSLDTEPPTTGRRQQSSEHGWTVTICSI